MLEAQRGQRPSEGEDEDAEHEEIDDVRQTVPKAEAQPTTMDQVVDRFVLRERGLVKMLETRTPVLETYLQNLTLDPALGPVPKDDRYFLGRMDLSESIDRRLMLGMSASTLFGMPGMALAQQQPAKPAGSPSVGGKRLSQLIAGFVGSAQHAYLCNALRLCAVCGRLRQ